MTDYTAGVEYDFTREADKMFGNEQEGPAKELAKGVPEFLKMLQDAGATHLKKNADYSGNNDAYENFHRAAIIMEWFDRPIDKVFACLIGVKLARAANLANKSHNSGLVPNNEAIEDTYMDMMVYTGMWGSYDNHQANKRAEGQQKSPGPEFVGQYGAQEFPDLRTSASKKRADQEQTQRIR